jgi:hypothetical protein
MSDEKILKKDYSTHSDRVLSRLIGLRRRQIKRYEQNQPSTNKSLLQLVYERDAMMTELLERSMAKDSDPKSK